ncbi:hypothetical protein ACS0TY_016631 [Phlomoides rotata]
MCRCHKGGGESCVAVTVACEKEKVVMCSKKDWKGWQCRREAPKIHSLCEHRLSMIKSYGINSGHNLTKNSEKAAGDAPPHRHIRPKKAPSSNPNEFFYYSGFEPRLGKKERGNQHE